MDHWFYSVSPKEKEARKLEVSFQFLKLFLCIFCRGIQDIDYFYKLQNNTCLIGTTSSVVFINCTFQVKKMFEKADKNGDGKLTKTEWMDVLRQSSVTVTEYDILI